MMTFAALQAALAALGYIDGAPPGFCDGPPLDAEAAEAACCAHCGRVGLHFRPYHRPRELRYVALMVCPACQWADQL